MERLKKYIVNIKYDKNKIITINEKSNPQIKQRLVEQKKQNQRDRDKEFDDFMNQHSYSRVVSNKNLIKQMNKLPNKVKALLLGNVFNKFDE